MEKLKKKYFVPVILLLAFCAVLAIAFRLGMNFAASGVPVQAKSAVSHPLDLEGREKVFLYFSDPGERFLSVEIRELSLPKAASERAKKILAALLEGPADPLISVIPGETRLLALYIEEGVALVDFSREIRENHPKSSHAERLTLYAIANSLILNVPEIQSVKVLIHGQEEDSLAGHVMTRYPLTANMTIVQ